MLPSTRRSDHISRTTCSFGRRSRSRSQHPGGACDAQPTASARGSPPPTTTAASWGDPQLQPHLRRKTRPMRRGTPRCNHTASRKPRPRVGPLSSCHAAAEPRADGRHRPPRPRPGALPDSIGILAAPRIQRAAARRAATTWPATTRGGRLAPGSALCRPQLRLSDRPRARRRGGLASGSSTAGHRPLALKKAAGAGVNKRSTCVGPARRRERVVHM
jgi:hypothetical protein